MKLFFLSCLFVINSYAQDTIRIYGKGLEDVYLHSSYTDSAYNDHQDLMACAWTVGYEMVLVRNLMKVDLSQLPKGVKIQSATLNLFGQNSNIQHGGHAAMGNSNAGKLIKITEQWNARDVGWQNQPSINGKDFIDLTMSNVEIQDYKGIDITKWVRGWVQNPKSNNGFMFKIAAEKLYTRLIFASGNHPDKSIRPYVEIITKEKVVHDLVFEQQPTFIHPLNEKRATEEVAKVEEIEIEQIDIDAFESIKEPENLEEVGIIIPTSFSPNADGENDVLKIAYGRVFNFKFVVFGENGGPVYKTNNPGFEWNGLSNGKKLSSGNYKWTVSGKDIKGRSFDFMGTIEIK